MNIVNIVFIINIVISLIFINVKQTVNNKKTYIVICGVLLGFVMAFRCTPYAADYQNYSVEYRRSANMNIEECFNEKGPLSFLVNMYLNMLTPLPQTFFVFTGIFTVASFMIWIYKNSSNIPLSIIAFHGLLYYSAAMNIVRQYMAVSILLIAYDVMLKNSPSIKNFIVYGCLTYLAYLYHSSALVMLPMYFIIFLKVPQEGWKSIALYIIFLIVINVMVSYGYDRFYESYDNTEGYGTDNASIFGLLLPSAVFISAFLKRKDLISINKRNNMLINFSAMAWGFTLYSITGALIIQRISIYFSVINILLIPEIIDVYMKKFDKKTRTIIGLLLLSIYYCTMIYLKKVPYIYQLDLWIFGGRVNLW